MSNWWDEAPLASAKPAGDWWSQAPLASAAPQAEPPIDPAFAKSVGDLLTRDGQIHAQVRNELDAEKGAGLQQDGTARRIAQGATFNTADEILAAAMTIPNMMKRGVGFSDGYAYAKAKEDMRLEDARNTGGIPGYLGEAAGGLVSGVGLANAGLTAIPAATARLGSVAGTALGGAVDGAVLGGVSGFADGEGDRLSRAGADALHGGLVGGALPIAAAALKPVVAPIASNVMARVNPEAYAERQVARAATRSGQTPDEIANRVEQAAIEGQGEYRLMDGLDYPGARLGAVVAKNPGEGRTELRGFLNDRQEGQSYRLGNALAEGFEAPVTAQRATADMTAARNAAADTAYGQARADGGLVDTSRALDRIRDVLDPSARGIVQVGEEVGHIAPDSVEAVLGRARSLLASNDTRKVGFEAVQRVKGDLDDAVGKAVRAGENNKARLLGQVTHELDAALEAASPSYAGARDAYRQGSRNIEAVETGRSAAGRGRTEDKIATFSGLSPEEQAAFRVGYVDPLIARVQGAAEGANKARPFTSQAAQTELPAFAAEGRRDALMRQVGRENEMFGNRAEALGNSKTAENLADNADTGIDPGILAKILTGNFTGATKDALTRGAAALNGNTEAVRSHMAKLLMEGDRGKILTMLLRLGQQNAGRGALGDAAFRGLLAGGMPAVNVAIAESGKPRPALVQK